MSEGGLDGFTVGVTADRRGDDQVVLLHRLGVEAVRGPVLRTETGADDADLRAATERLIASPPDVLVANTGFGMRTWWARVAAWGLDEPLTTALEGVRILARGPKAAGALRSLGLEVAWRAPTEQLDAVADHLVSAGVAGARVAFQRHGDDDRVLTERLRAAGAVVDEIPVYRWMPATDAGAAADLVRRCCDGTVDAVTFTAGPAVRHFVDVAEAEGVVEGLLAALNRRMVVVCVGPVCAAVAREEGITDPVIPEHWRLGAMVTLVGRALAARRWHLEGDAGPVVVEGGMVRGSGWSQALPAAARRGLGLLVSQRGGPVGVADLAAVGATPADIVAVAGLSDALVVEGDRIRLDGWPADVDVAPSIPG